MRVKEKYAADDVHLFHANFSEIEDILQDAHVESLDGALLDLGVSSYQLQDPNRGFSYMIDMPLDMRMDKESKRSAQEIVNTAQPDQLARILEEYGEERWAKRIADFIVKERSEAPIQTTGRLVSIIKAAIPKGARKDGPHPAKRTFQALRIAVNDELDGLASALESYVRVLRPGGRLAVLTFHSLEDRIVKNTFRRLADPCECPKDFPVCVCGKKPQVKIITRKPVVSSASELEENPRARSAKLRVIEKI